MDSPGLLRALGGPPSAPHPPDRIRWLRRLIAPSSKVLLASSGGGRELEAILPSGAKVTAVDYAEGPLRIGRERWGDLVDWVRADAHDLRCLPDSFDVAVCLSAFNYFVDPPRALAEIASRLRPGGLMIVSVLNAEHPTERDRPSPRVTRCPSTAAQAVAMAEGADLRDVRLRGHRVLADRLLKRRALPWVLPFEPMLGRVAGPRRCKWIWLLARK